MHRVQDESRRTPGLIVHCTVLRQYGHTEGAREPRAGNLNLNSNWSSTAKLEGSDRETRTCGPGGAYQEASRLYVDRAATGTAPRHPPFLLAH